MPGLLIFVTTIGETYRSRKKGSDTLQGLLSSYQVQKCPHHLPGSNLPSLGQINAKVCHTAGLELLRSDLLINPGSPPFFYYPRLLFNESTSLFLMFSFDVYLKHIPTSRVWVF